MFLQLILQAELWNDAAVFRKTIATFFFHAYRLTPAMLVVRTPHEATDYVARQSQMKYNDNANAAQSSFNQIVRFFVLFKVDPVHSE